MPYKALLYAGVLSMVPSILLVYTYDSADQVKFYKAFPLAGRCEILPGINGELDQFLINGSEAGDDVFQHKHGSPEVFHVLGATTCDFRFGPVCPGLIGLRIPIVMYVDTGFETSFCDNLILRTRHEFTEAEMPDARELLLQIRNESPAVRCRRSGVRDIFVMLDERRPGWTSILSRAGWLWLALWTVVFLCYVMGVSKAIPSGDGDDNNQKPESDPKDE